MPSSKERPSYGLSSKNKEAGKDKRTTYDEEVVFSETGKQPLPGNEKSAYPFSPLRPSPAFAVLAPAILSQHPIPETSPPDGARQELLEAFDRRHPEDLDNLRGILHLFQELALHSRDTFDKLLQSLPRPVLNQLRDQVETRIPKEKNRQYAFDFVSPSIRPWQPVFGSEEETCDYRATRPVPTDKLPLEALCDLTRSRLEAHFLRADLLTTPELTKQYLMACLAPKEREVFSTIFLDNRHRVIAYEELFFGTIDGCTVHVREVIKRALHHNAAATIFAHNHPSGVTDPSSADRQLTQRLKDALSLIDVRVLDHIVIGGSETVSLSECGLL
jgi:hypothetical protein